MKQSQINEEKKEGCGEQELKQSDPVAEEDRFFPQGTSEEEAFREWKRRLMPRREEGYGVVHQENNLNST